MLTYSAIVVTLIALIVVLRTLRAVTKVPVFEEIETMEPDRWPLLTVIIPACNEAENIEDAVTKMQQQDYPELEIILVNDRSTDGTGEIAEQLAADDRRTRVIHIDQLPVDWLGKVHALHTGLGQAHGEWILFTDADVCFAPDLLRKAMAHALFEQLDHFTLIPKFVGGSFWLRVAVSTFEHLALERSRITELGKPDSAAFLGVGAFNLVRRQTLEQTPGMEWLRMEVIDDLGLAFMLMLAGARSGGAVCRRDLYLEWYRDLPHMARGVEKNFFAAMQFNVFLTLLAAFGLAAGVAAPVFLLFSEFYFFSIALYTLFALVVQVFGKRMGRALIPGLSSPLGVLIIVVIMLRTAWLCHTRGGISWRGAHYDLASLKRGQRVKLWNRPKRRSSRNMHLSDQ